MDAGVLAAGLFGVAIALAGAEASGPDEDLARLRRFWSGPHPPPAAQIARDLDRVALAYLDRGDLGRAIELLSEASDRDPGNGSALAHLALAYVRNGDFEFARATADLAAAASNAPAHPFCEIGSLAAAAHRLEDAMSAWETCRRLGGAALSFAGPLEAARIELAVAGQTRSLESGRFTVVADARIPAALLLRVGDHLAAEDSRREAFLQSASPPPQVVVLYAGRTFFTLVSIPDWVSGVFDGKIRVAIDPAAPVTPALESVLAHELAHAAVRDVSGDRAPGWLHEGLAQWCEGRRLLRQDLREIFTRRPVAALSELEASLGRADLERARVSYAEALGLVEFLLESRGPGAVRCVLSDLAAGERIDAALLAETGWDPSTLVAAWIRWAGLKESPAARR